MVMNGGNPDGLSRVAFMQSGSPIPVGNIIHGQQYYDAPGCSSASVTLQFMCADCVSFESIVLAWQPHMDGDFLTDEPQNLVQQLEGSIADVPFVTGSCDDEGTLFSVSTLNIT
ncbi:hypothetical protein PAXINDRAFT_12297 [Paxillus involutus ATCC 200175]|uniref:Uncharacterized protein n=1 Tax=Paxillus involutus ATCC 200175 TaxID=664439 RepID=A0A0C9U6H8_PAXIN|nr:hypothetical protein PAXINDRAFT_12297 [Paxillus involutus ATCC 200175]